MSTNKIEYRIEVWQDEWNGSSWDETKVVTIGANDMDFLGRARNPILKIDVNGEVNFSFDMNTRYFDSFTGKKEDNYLLPYLFNEAKVKVYCPAYDDGINNGWFDFIIKEIKENRGTNISYSYVCQYLPINELSKTGQNLVFSLDLENSTGKINELEQKVIDGTEWILGDIAADLTEATEETLFKVTTTQLLNLIGLSTMAGKPDDITNLPIGSTLYVPYSEIVNTTSTSIQVIYVEGDFIFENGNIISNKKCNYTINKISFGTPTYVATEYRGYKIVLTYRTEYKDVSTDLATSDYRYVTIYSKTGSSTVYYGYTNTEVISNDPLEDIVVGVVQHYFYYSGNTIINADNETGLTPVLITNSQKYRTLEASQSNRFNLTQSIAELFEVWARFDVYHDNDGKITSKRISFVDTIGSQNWAGFTYGINLTGITRNVVSSNLSTKMLVTAIENENLSTGSCSIAYAKGNVAKEEFLINLDYYTQVGLLDNEVLTYDLYDVNGSTGIGYLTKLGNLNIQYDNYSNTAVSLETYIAQYTELVAAMNDAITAAQQVVDSILKAYNGGVCSTDAKTNYDTNYANAVTLVNTNTTKRNNYQAQLDYYNNQKIQVDTDKASIIAQKKVLNETFNNKYSRYIQEGTWAGESTYVDNDLYYYDAQNVLLESSRPSIEYTINVVDISILIGYEDYNYKIGDITYIEDVEYFGYTLPDIHGYSMPHREQVIVSSIECNLDSPISNKITVQNYKNQFDSLFQRVMATVQTYQLNEQVYQRANNFTTNGQITFDSLQSSLINNNLILTRSLTEDVVINKTGITLTDQENMSKMVRIVSGGVFLSSDGGMSWKSGITGNGINTDLLTAGQIDVGKINIMNGAYPTFSWDSTGLYAYKYTGTPGSLTMDKTSYVRFNQDGIYGAKANTKMFSLDWNGLYLKTGNSSHDIQLGSHMVNSTEYLFSAIKNSDNKRTFSIDADGNAYFAGKIEATSGTLDSITADNFTLNTGIISGNVSFYGDVAELAVNKVVTADKVGRYKAGNTSELNYIEIENQSLRFVTGTTTGNTVQHVDREGDLLYWTDAEETAMTEIATAYPVLVYNYTELSKLHLSFELESGSHVPMIVLGAGTGIGDNAKAKIYKDPTGVVFSYKTTNGVTNFIRIGDDGITTNPTIGGGGGGLSSDITYYVATTGSDTTGDGSSGLPFATIQHCVALIPKSLNGHDVTINVGVGLFPSAGQNVTFSNFYGGRIKIIGAGQNSTTLQKIAVVNCDAVLFQNLAFAISLFSAPGPSGKTQDGTSIFARMGLYCENSKVFIKGDLKMSDNSLSTGAGIYAVKDSSVIFCGDSGADTIYFYNCSIGIRASSMSRCHFEDCGVSGTNNTSLMFAESGGMAGLGGENFGGVEMGSFTELTRASTSGIYINEINVTDMDA